MADASAVPRPAGRRWVLSEEAFQGLLRALDPDAGRAGQKYELLRKKLLIFFLGRRSREAEEEADETLDRVSRRIFEGEPIEDVTRFAHGVARRVHSEYLRRERRHRRAREALFAVPTPGLSPLESEPGLECIRGCIAGLPARDRALIVEYYDGSGPDLKSGRRELAARLGLSPLALRLRAYRIRRAVEDCTRDCLFGKTGRAAGRSGDGP